MTQQRPSTGRVYGDYDRMIARVEDWVASKRPTLPGCDERHLRARIVQRVVELTNAAFSHQALQQSAGSPAPTAGFSADGVRICTTTGRVSVSPALWVALIGQFCVVWADALLGLLPGLFGRAPAPSVPATVLMEAAGGYEDCDDRFVRFCRDGPIAPLSATRRLIVRAQRPPRKATSPDVMYTTRPFVHLINNSLSASARWSAFVRHLTAPWRYVRALAATPLNVLAGRDVALLPLIERLDRTGTLEAVVVTTSAFTSQPLWMKGFRGQRFKLHMVWYSQNFIPKMYVGDSERPDLPQARHMRVDVHWVWTQGFREYLAGFQAGSEIHVVGPILWYLPGPFDWSTIPAQDPIKVAVFDITPLPDGTTAFGAAKNYYSVALITKFVADIVSTCDEIAAATSRRVVVLLKHKRPPRPGRHDSSYLEWLDALTKSHPDFHLIDPQANLFGLLRECDLSVSVPYTSTAYVSDALSKPALYYDPFAELVPRYEETPFVHFASGSDELRRLMFQLSSASCLKC